MTERDNEEFKSPENTSIEPLIRTAQTIELCGTPYPHRFQSLVHNGIEDLLTPYAGEKIRGSYGFEPFYRFSSADKLKLLADIDEVKQKIRYTRRRMGVVNLVMDSAMQSIVYLEMARRIGVLSEEEKSGHITDLISSVEKENLIIATLLSPRATLGALMYPAQLVGYEIGRRRQLGIAYLYNEAFYKSVHTVLHHSPSTNIKVIKIGGDEFKRDVVFLMNATAVLDHLII